VKHKIEAAFHDRKRSGRDPVNHELPLAQKIISDAAIEFTDATGAILGATDDLGFVLSLFPEQFYFYMKANPEVIQRWLDQASATLFRGEPEERDDLEKYKRLLIAKVERYQIRDSLLISTRNKVLEMLKLAPITSID
jgi:hypothetical protein